MRHSVAAFFLCGLIAIPATLGLAADDVFKQSGVKGGFVVHLGAGGTKSSVATENLLPSDSYIVHALSSDPENVAAVRKRLQSLGLYGRVSADHWDGTALPYSDNLVNLIVAEEGVKVSKAELLRVLAPRGVALVRDSGSWRKMDKPWPKEMDEWTHYFHEANGNPTSKDELTGPPEHLQWIGSPRWSRHHDHMASMTSMVTAMGRVFYILDEGLTASIQMPSRWRLIARDAFNGAILWKRDIGEWGPHQYGVKSGPAHLVRRLAANGERIYVTLGIDAPMTALNGATGELETNFEGSEFTKEVLVSDGVVFLVVGNGPSRLPSWKRLYTNVWANRDRANSEWGWPGIERRVLAYDEKTGKQLWSADAPVAPCSLAVDAQRAVFHDGEKLVCLDRRDGTVIWNGEANPVKLPVPSNTGPRIVLHENVVLFAGNDGKMSGWSAKDGKKIWEQQHKPSGHNSLKDLLVVDGLVWTGDIAGGASNAGTFTGYDVITGAAKREFPIDVDLNWFHHRCYPSKATGKYIMTARNGTEFVDLENEHWIPHHWVRSTCMYGVMPANGMMYATMDACGCQLEAKLNGFKALAPGPIDLPKDLDLSGTARLKKGPAYGQVQEADAKPSDWPTFRHDSSRSGSTEDNVAPAALKQTWKTQLKGRLSAPTAAAGRLYISSIDTHTVHALDALTGAKIWQFTAGGRVDSPPTYYKGLVLFGSADGHVYALRAKDGAEAWRFRGAPMDRRIMAWEQLESVWPVHGSVLVNEGVLYCTAGRNMYLDGGIHMIRLNPLTGALLGEEVMTARDPETGKDMHDVYVKTMTGNNMPVALSDVLSCDGKNVWMRSQKFDLDGKRQEIALEPVTEQPADGAHLFCQNGFLDDTYFFRSYWTYGRRVTGGYGYWPLAGRLIPSGRILCFDDERVYGFGRKPEYMTNASVLEYEFFASNKIIPDTPDGQAQANKKGGVGGTSDWRMRYSLPREQLSKEEYKWTVDQPSVIARAITLAGGNVFFAGPPSVVNERRAFRFPDDPEVQSNLERQEEILRGTRDGQLWALSKKDGSLQARYALASPPVFDGMIAADSGLYVATLDGHVLRLSQKGSVALPTLKDLPLSTAWSESEPTGKPEAPKKARRTKQSPRVRKKK
jgi:outer membrane protein assembly factor BamB